MSRFYNDVLEEMYETGGLRRPILTASTSSALSPASTEIRLFVFINAETDTNTYVLEFTHIEHDGLLPMTCVDRTERFDSLCTAVHRFEEVTNMVYDTILRRELAERKGDDNEALAQRA